MAERGGFGAATSKLHLSQSRVSAHISALEDLLGFALFERRVRPIALTEPGRIFAEHAREALDALQDGIEAARVQRSGRATGTWSSGATPASAQPSCRSVLACLNASHPGDVRRDPRRQRRVARGGAELRRGRRRIPAVAASCPRPPAHDEAALARIDRRSDARRRPSRRAGARRHSRPRGAGLDRQSRAAAARTAADSTCGMRQEKQPTRSTSSTSPTSLRRSSHSCGPPSASASSASSLSRRRPTDGIAVREIDSPTAFRDVALFWNDQGSRNPSLARVRRRSRSRRPPRDRATTRLRRYLRAHALSEAAQESNLPSAGLRQPCRF